MKTLEQIETFTEDLLNQHGLMVAPINLSKFAKSVGIFLNIDQLPEGTWGLAYVEAGQKIISINRNQSKNRERFTTAHEIGHLYLDTEKPLNVDKKIYYRNEKSDWRERRANYFASCLLIPKVLVTAKLKEISSEMLISDEEIETLATHFQVSTQAMYIRLEQLNLF